MKIFEREDAGYSEECLEDFLESTLFPSAFFDQPVPVRGVCFAAGVESLSLAEEFAANHLGLGTITFQLETMDPAELRALTLALLPPRAEFSRIAIILPHLDRVGEDLQARFAETICSTPGALWFPAVSDQRWLIPSLREAFLVYLGLSPKNCMRFLAQSRQQLIIDDGSLQR